jgi:hypothetical protein
MIAVRIGRTKQQQFRQDTITIESKLHSSAQRSAAQRSAAQRRRGQDDDQVQYWIRNSFHRNEQDKTFDDIDTKYMY